MYLTKIVIKNEICFIKKFMCESLLNAKNFFQGMAVSKTDLMCSGYSGSKAVKLLDPIVCVIKSGDR
jgi:hypothetical protein